MPKSIPIHGFCAPEFAKVKTAFERNFENHGEVGATCSVIYKGETVVDLWGGHKEASRKNEWEEDTVSIVFSCTKAATALCAQILVDRGLLDLDAKVTDYWPEFGQNGKEDVTVRMMLCHQSALPALRKPVKPGGFYDWDYMVRRLSEEKPFWAPGIDNGYHFVTFGWTVGELVRRVSGKSLGTFFNDEIAEPLGVDFHIGLHEDEFRRMANMILFVPNPLEKPSDFVKAVLSNPNSIQFLALLNSGAHFQDSKAAWRAEIGGGGGVSNGRALAKLFANLLGPDSILSKPRIDDMRKPAAETEKDRTLLIPTRFGQGFMLRMDNRHIEGEGNSLLVGEGAFGHVGMGGSLGFADPEAELAFGYSMRTGLWLFHDKNGRRNITQ